MYRGTKTYKCSKCGEIFIAHDIEQNATVESMPVTCPQCGNKTNAEPNLIDKVKGVFK